VQTFTDLFIAKEGPDFVSAVVLEQRNSDSVESAGLLIRLASNKTPTVKTIDGLRGLLEVVVGYARAGESQVLELDFADLVCRKRKGDVLCKIV
jgi:hypothetical protein